MSLGTCAANYDEFLETAHSALVFRVSIVEEDSEFRKCSFQLNQIESIDNKVRRMTKFKKIVENKAGKVEFFKNVTDILLEAMGGYFSNYI